MLARLYTLTNLLLALKHYNRRYLKLSISVLNIFFKTCLVASDHGP